LTSCKRCAARLRAGGLAQRPPDRARGRANALGRCAPARVGFVYAGTAVDVCVLPEQVVGKFVPTNESDDKVVGSDQEDDDNSDSSSDSDGEGQTSGTGRGRGRGGARGRGTGRGRGRGAAASSAGASEAPTAASSRGRGRGRGARGAALAVGGQSEKGKEPAGAGEEPAHSALC
jgi:hypothetical protein